MPRVTAAPSEVFWDADPELPDWPGRPALEGTVTADACVVGLGGSGLAAVEELVTRGLRVVALDAGRVAHGAAGRNGGILSCGGAIRPAAGAALSEELRRELYLRTRRELDRLADQLGPDVVRRVGTLQVAGFPGKPTDSAEAEDRALELAELRQDTAVLRRWGVAVEDYDGDLGRGYYTPDTAGMNPVRRALGLAAALGDGSGGAILHEHSPVQRVTRGRVDTDRGAVLAPIVIIAVDGRLLQLVPALGRVARTIRLQMLATGPLSARRLTCPTSFRRGFEWAQQDANGRLALGGGRDRFWAEEETDDDRTSTGVQGHLDRAAARLAGEPVTVTHRWAASVTYTDDHRALVVPTDDGVVACGGYSGSGNLVGPVAARAAVALALDGTTPPAYFRSELPDA